ncbi:hypothetical protein MRS44_017933 [Fusarium solani]|uniref:uncharacterized protein n=1 Tax=Fusarium solani TaxID=169388 RepID=UPI0032C49358|nr:hypothetical protein MRS44_017933 [Fusarium solani]
MDNYQKLEKIGQGTCGAIYKARDLASGGRIVALKKIRLEAEDEGLYLVFEFLDIDLKRYMEALPVSDGGRGKVLPEGSSAYLMQLGMNDMVLFGVPLRPYTHDVVTLWYRAPELLLGGRQYSTGVDMWSVGCIFAEMCARKPLFPGDSEIDEIFKIFRTLGTPTEDVWPGVTSYRHFKSSFPKWQRNYDQALCNNLNKAGLELLDMTLIYDPARRISAKQACNHRYFEGFLA